jgi:predicted O-methyltransferase YrrM
LLQSTDVGLEFGSGRSTIWFARKVAYLTTVEHNRIWHEEVKRRLKENSLLNVRALLFESDTVASDGTYKDLPEYVDVVNKFEPKSLDFVLVDGVVRSACAVASVDRIKMGGVLILDNANWYLASQTFSPGSRKPEQGPSTEEWALFLERVKGWRRIWTTSGVTDTVIFICP